MSWSSLECVLGWGRCLKATARPSRLGCPPLQPLETLLCLQHIPTVQGQWDLRHAQQTQLILKTSSPEQQSPASVLDFASIIYSFSASHSRVLWISHSHISPLPMLNLSLYFWPSECIQLMSCNLLQFWCHPRSNSPVISWPSEMGTQNLLCILRPWRPPTPAWYCYPWLLWNKQQHFITWTHTQQCPDMA